MENKQTAVAWLAERFEKFLAYYEGHHKAEVYSIHQLSNDFEQALQMEKEQIVNAVCYDPMYGALPKSEGEHYYNKNYKK